MLKVKVDHIKDISILEKSSPNHKNHFVAEICGWRGFHFYDITIHEVIEKSKDIKRKLNKGDYSILETTNYKEK